MSEKELERIKREYTLQIKPLIDYALKIPGTPKHTRIISQNFEEIMDRSLKIDQIYGYMAQHIDFLR